jgi:glutamate transport system substrate-binding protein
MRVRRIGIALAAVAVLGSGVAACGQSASSASLVDKAKNDKKLTIGVKYDQPGLGLKLPNGKVDGFDVATAKYVAGKLGVPESGITWKETRSANRESYLQQGQVDLVLASYSIIPDRLNKVTFGGPYYVAHQDTLVRGDDDSIKTVKDLKGKRLCQVAGSNSWKRVTDDEKVPNVKLVPASAYDECITKLQGKSIDALSTDDLILAGYSARQPGKFKLLNKPFTDEKYGIGIRKGDKKGCEAVNKAVTSYYSDGTAQKNLKEFYGKTGLKLGDTVPKFQGCS